MMRPTRRRARRGLTLVELLVAVVVMGVGVLGLAGTASYVAVQMGGGGQRTVAAAVGQQVFDSLLSVDCHALVSGTDSTRNVRVTWLVADSGKTRWIRQRVRFRHRKGKSSVVDSTAAYSSMVACP
jgi:prepilin-type N-terminal cleavage/methylation domain-containing protein